MGPEVELQPVIKGFPDEKYLAYLEDENPQLQKQPPCALNLIGTELRNPTLSGTDCYEGEGAAVMAWRVDSPWSWNTLTEILKSHCSKELAIRLPQ